MHKETKGSKAVKFILIGVSFLFVIVMLVLPLITVIVESLNKGETIIPFIEDKEKLMKICDAAIEFFAENAKPSERFKYTIDRVGKDKFEKKILEVYNG